MSFNTSNSTTAHGPDPTNRPRIRSAPCEPDDRVPWPPQLPGSFRWSQLDEVGKRVREWIKRLITVYSPPKYESIILRKIDTLSALVGDTLNDERRSRISSFYSSTVSRLDDHSLPVSKGTLIILITIFLLIVSIPLQIALIALILGFALPLYVIFVCTKWFVAWRHKNRPHADRPSPETLNYWWAGSILIDFLILLISHVTLNSVTDEGSLLSIVVKYVLPIVAFVAAKVYLERQPGHGWVLDYFLLAYTARYFAIRGCTLLPNGPRPFVAYVACYFGVASGCNKKISVSWAPDCMSAQGENVKAASSGSMESSLPPQSPRTSSLPQFAPASPSTLRNRIHLSDASSEPSIRAMAAGGGRTSRRVSLPAGSLLPLKGSQSNLSEARGMLADMLAQKDLPAHLVAGLKAVSGLLTPGSSHANLVSHFDFVGTIPRVIDSPYIGGDVSVASVETAAQRRQSPAVVWSTTTSATGLPNLEPEPCRSRSSSYWKQRHLGENENGKESSLGQSLDLPSKLIQLTDGTICDLEEINRDPYLIHLKEWSVPVFDLYADSPETILTRVAYTVFRKSGLFRIFKINKQKFMSFFHALEKGYWNIPYHNRVHATDVLHATYYFTCNKVPAIASTAARARFGLGSIEEQNEDNGSSAERGENRDEQEDWSDLMEGESPSPIDDQSGTLASVLSSLELLGLYTAAAMHDFDHPGRTNAFLVASQDPKAILYNDRSVLENHHAAAAWQLLGKPENNFVEQLDAAEFKRLRYIIIEAILATDLKRHFEIMVDFNGKVSKGLDWNNEADKQLTSQICIKMADISSPTKPGALHKEWTGRILEEFYAQGDEEKARGLPLSPYMDRQNSQVALLQDSFIAHLVAPLAMAMNDAGLLPLTVSDPNNGEAPKSELLVNLENNHKQWKIELGEDPASAVQAVPHDPTSSSGRNCSPMTKEEDEMETIEEHDDETSATDS